MKVPVKCNVNKPQRPEYTGNVVVDLVNLLEYIEELEILLNTCTEVE